MKNIKKNNNHSFQICAASFNIRSPHKTKKLLCKDMFPKRVIMESLFIYFLQNKDTLLETLSYFCPEDILRLDLVKPFGVCLSLCVRAS